MNNKNYILNTGSETKHRLSILEKIYGEYTSKLFQEINFQKGMKVAVIGCGSGSGIDQIYEKIGRDGRILCLDISPEQISLTKNVLDSKEINNVDYIVADIEKYIGNCDYDVVYCRFVLIHLQNPILALKSMLSLIKENGFIACEEHNYEDIFNYPTSNSIDKYRALLKKISNILQLDYAFGKKLYYEMNLLNIDISYIKKFIPLCTSYDEKTLLLLSLIEEKNHFISQDLLEEGEIKEMIEEMQIIADKKEIIQSPGSVFQCIGKKK
ncbi:MAG: class I SAM-dependent methyltransferase [Rickettsiales bacterium]|nr:class I SAM-dependent methyltransferase [Rickettsiales bacterium]